MLDVKWILQNEEDFSRMLEKREVKNADIKKIKVLHDQIKTIKAHIQKLNITRKSIAEEFFSSRESTAKQVQYKTQAEQVKKTIDSYTSQQKTLEKALQEILSYTPNILSDDVHKGKHSEDNKEIKRNLCHLKKNTSRHHIDIVKNPNLVETEKTVEMSGTRMITLQGDLAKMKRALENFMLDIHINEFFFQEVCPPLIVKDHAMYQAGQLPKFDAESFSTTRKDRLIPTAEVPLVNLIAKSLLKDQDLPIRYTAATPCFRSEAGSAGRDTKGIIRLHQFNKVELVSVCTTEQAASEHQHILNAAEMVLQKLQLPYRVVLLCAQDTGFTAKKTYDIEVWMPSQNQYKEISSCSLCGDFQSRRLRAKYEDITTMQKHFVQTLNGSGLAIERTIAAIIEQYTQGNIMHIPTALQPYMKQDKIILNEGSI